MFNFRPCLIFFGRLYRATKIKHDENLTEEIFLYENLPIYGNYLAMVFVKFISVIMFLPYIEPIFKIIIYKN